MAISLIFLSMVLGPKSASANQYCQFEENLSATRPQASEGKPTEIHVRLFLKDLVDIVTLKQEFTVDLFYTASWLDPRAGAEVRRAGVSQCRVPLDQIWRPEMATLNKTGGKGTTPEYLEVSEDGTVVGKQRLFGTFQVPFDLRNFPMDSQILTVTFISTKYSPEEVKVVFDAADRETTFSESGWIVEQVLGKSSKYDFGVAQAEEETQGYSRFDLEIHVKRQTIFYLWKIFLPLSLIVMVSWSIFWIPPTQLGIQTGIGTAMMLTLIAFLFSLQNFLPKVNYLTRMDLFVYSSLGFVFLAFLEAVISGNLANGGHERAAFRLDWICRIIFPLTFALTALKFWEIL